MAKITFIIKICLSTQTNRIINNLRLWRYLKQWMVKERLLQNVITLWDALSLNKMS